MSCSVWLQESGGSGSDLNTISQPPPVRRTRWCQFGLLERVLGSPHTTPVCLNVCWAHSLIYASLCVSFECAPRAGAILFIKRQQAASWMIDERVCTCLVPVAAPKSTAPRILQHVFFLGGISGFTGLISRFVGWMKNLRDGFHKAEREIEAPSSSSKCHEMCMWHFRTANADGKSLGANFLVDDFVLPCLHSNFMGHITRQVACAFRSVPKMQMFLTSC